MLFYNYYYAITGIGGDGMLTQLESNASCVVCRVMKTPIIIRHYIN